MDFLDRVKEYLETELSLPYPIIVGVLGAESPSIAIRQAPSAVIDRYADRGKTFEFSFQVLMKDKGRKQINVIDTMSRIFDLLDGLPSGSITSNDGSFNFVTCECSTLPNFVEKTDHNEYIYTNIYTTDLEKGGLEMAFNLMSELTFEIQTGEDETTQEPIYSKLAAGSMYEEPANSEELSQDRYFDSAGFGESDVIGAQLVVTFSGHRDYDDEAQNYIFE